jgi:hypothetical protein
MGLNWLITLGKLRAPQRQGESEQSEACQVERILFIGFGRIPGFYWFNWDDWDWLNAADFEVVFINCFTLLHLLHDWERDHSENATDVPETPIKRLRDNLRVLEAQVTQIINSGRAVFALTTHRTSFRISFRNGHHYYPSTYDWCPLPVETRLEEGEVINDVDPRFSKYRQQLKKWVFYYDIKPRKLEQMDRSDLLRGQHYVLLPKDLFQNLSLHPLGVELRYGVVDQAKLDLSGVSGPIYLLHFPIGGDVRLALRSLLQEFCTADLVESEEPEWVDLIKPPRGAEIDEQLRELFNEIEDLSKKRARLLEKREQLEYWRRLVYGSGDMLEEVVLEALKLLGLQNARLGPKGGYDIVGEFAGETLLFEVKGLKGAVGRKHVFDLDRHVNEFELKNPSEKVAKGVLVANAYCNDSPDTREEGGKQIFAGDAVDHARLLEFALLDTRILYRLITDTLEGNLTNTNKVLEVLRNTIGVYSQ